MYHNVYTLSRSDLIFFGSVLLFPPFDKLRVRNILQTKGQPSALGKTRTVLNHYKTLYIASIVDGGLVAML